jgi:FkbM family methyltransferase
MTTQRVIYGGWTFPPGEAHLPQWIKKVNDVRDGRKLYQGAKYRLALSYVKQRRTAVDIGGHIGLWSWPMSKDFERVRAFEPMPEHRECYAVNMADRHNFVLHPVALGDGTLKTVHVRTRTHGSSGDTGVDLSGNGLEVPCLTLDSFELNEVDFLKCDCEGFELFVMKGAVETLKRNKPVVIVEQKPETGMEKNYNIGTKDAVRFLESLGARQVAERAGDHIMTWTD